MKKAFLLAAVILGTTVMVNAQTEPAKAAPAKEVKASKHPKKADKKVAVAPTAKMEPAKAAAKK